MADDIMSRGSCGLEERWPSDRIFDSRKKFESFLHGLKDAPKTSCIHEQLAASLYYISKKNSKVQFAASSRTVLEHLALSRSYSRLVDPRPKETPWSRT